MKKIPKEISDQVKELKRKTQEQRQQIRRISELVKKEIEREPGIWEYDFDELEQEIWNKHSRIQDKIKDLSEQISECSGKSPRDIYRFYKQLRGNFIRQNVINQEIISFYLAVILTLQKIKDRLNSLEFRVDQINREKEELMIEIQELKLQLMKQEKEQ
ncbi:MAG: hypothetical protein GF421_04855 [Candidatus Aminicenantes bacterium]|nr:hypothetical protein [Candidatus Aminicenantes bacterium]